MSTCVVLNTTSCVAPISAESVTTYCLYNTTGISGNCTNNTGTFLTASAGSACFWCPTNAAAESTVQATTSSSSSLLSSSSFRTTPEKTTSTIASSTKKTSTEVSAQASNTGTGNPIVGPTRPAVSAAIGIGSAFAGALVAALAVFFLLRRKRGGKTYPEENLQSNNAGYSDRDLKGGIVTVTPVKGGVISNIDHLLPQPAEDDAIIGGLSKIRDGIKNHVQNYYHTSPVRPDMVDEARLVELANATNIPSTAILDLLLNPATRISTIRLLLAQLILSRCVSRADGQPSLLPLEFSLLAGYPFATSHTALFSKWKTISGVLLQPYGEKLSENDARFGSIKQALAIIEPIIGPFISATADMNARQRNLEGIMSRAVQFAFLLFVQPGSFSFDFTGTEQPGSLIVFPALLQTVSDEAGAIVPPRILSEKEVVTGLDA